MKSNVVITTNGPLSSLPAEGLNNHHGGLNGFAEDAFRHGRMEAGFYGINGDQRLIPWAMERLADLLTNDSQTSITHYRREGQRSNKTALGPLFWIDSGNNFDPYYMARLSSARGLDARRALRSIQVARPFTAFQFQRVLGKVPVESTWSLSQRTEKSAGRFQTLSQSLRWMPLVVISDVMSLFCDDEIKEMDVHRAYEDFTAALAELEKRAVVVGLMLNHRIPPARQFFYDDLMRRAQLLTLAKPVSIQHGALPQNYSMTSGFNWLKAG